MIRLTFIILIVHIIQLPCFSQVGPSIPSSEIMLSISPLNLILTSNHGIGPKIEIECKRKRYSLKLDGLIYINMNRGGKLTLLDDRFEYNSGYQVGVGIHRWFAGEEIYIGFNVNYKRQFYDAHYDVIYDSTYNNSSTLSSYSSTLSINKAVIMFHMNIGARVFIKNNIFIKPEVEIGIRHRNVKVSGLRSQTDILSGLNHFADDPAYGIRPSILFDVKIGYQFK